MGRFRGISKFCEGIREVYGLAETAVKADAGPVLAGIEALMAAQEWARENVRACRKNCDEQGRIAVRQFGTAVKVHCPIASDKCAHGLKLALRRQSYAFKNLPHGVPARCRKSLQTVTQTTELKKVARWDGDGFLYLTGASGSGKSFAAAWWIYREAVRRIAREGEDPTQWSRALADFLWLSATSVCLEREALYAAERATVLVLDDLGTEARSLMNKSLMNEIVGVRYNEARATIITSLLDPKSIEAEYGNARMYERIAQTGMVVDFGTGNFRLKKGAAADGEKS